MGSSMLENALRCLESYLTEFYQTFSIKVFWDKVECVSVWGAKVKGQCHSMFNGSAGRGMQSLTPYIKF